MHGLCSFITPLGCVMTPGRRMCLVPVPFVMTTMIMPAPIASPANPQVKYWQQLARSAARRKSGTFMVEGRRCIDGFLQHGWKPRAVLCRMGCELPASWPEDVLYRISDAVCRRVSSMQTPSGYLAEFALPTPQALDTRARGLILVGVSDPGNVGTLLRSAAAFAWSQVLVVGGADPWSPKVVAASAGALAGLQIHRLAEDTLPQDIAADLRLCCLVARDGCAPEELPRQNYWLVVGSEAHGLPPAWQEQAAYRLTLPMGSSVESLNAGVAGSIACWELHRAH